MAGDATSTTDGQTAAESSISSPGQGAEQTQSATENPRSDSNAGSTPTDVANNDNEPAVEQNLPDQGSQGNSRGQIEAEGGTTVNQLRPGDIVDLLNSAPPKRLMTREELDSWLMVHDKIAARRRNEHRGGSGFQSRRLRRRKTVF
jgi:hypothetical protein